MRIEKLRKKLIHQENQLLFRQRNVVEAMDGNKISVNRLSCINFSSNDYLGLKKHPKIIEAFIKSAKKQGVGSGASALISGYSNEHAEIEALFSKWLRLDKAILFNSGYCANVGIISALADRSDHLFSDKLCHASLLDGVTLSGAKHHRYLHGDMKSLRRLAEIYPPHLIITESIFSMEGDIAPIPELIEIATQHKAGLLIDDAHGIGILGKTGGGVMEHYDLHSQAFSCVILPLGKAFNAMGAIVAGTADVIETLLQFSKTYRYTTAMPPAVCSAIQVSLSLIQEENWRREQLIENIRFFIAYAENKKLSLISRDMTPIKPILIHDHSKLLALQAFLLSKGFYVSAIRPPTVPKNKARLRISLNSLHTQDEITQLIDHVLLGLKTC